MILYSLQSALKQLAFPNDWQFDKRTLRREMRRRRASHDPRAARWKNRRITERTLSLDALEQSDCIALYASTPEEVFTDDISNRLLQIGKTLVFPCVVGKELQFRRIVNLETDLIKTGSFGIREPDPANCPLVPIDAVDLFLTPGVAFDPFGGRIGYGGGYYDRILSKKRSGAPAIALAFEFQVVHAIQNDDHDCPVDRIVTEEAVYSPHLSTHVCPQAEDTESFAASLAQNRLGDGCIVALHADLGVGKTVFTQGLAKALNGDREIISPTFIYSREYNGEIPLTHIDAYRLDGVAAGDEPFWDELMDRPGLIVIEWAEHLGLHLPKNAIHCFGRICEDSSREWILFTSMQNHKYLHEGTLC
ncbi:MAG: 5-formyltetrahydrofolate cyclo-ligase [Candidatus Omnitrophica bacterium]|nr:5-formyltetrahydrofolate cyclo-ligase [Candidatus Omnitrophota bacterium]